VYWNLKYLGTLREVCFLDNAALVNCYTLVVTDVGLKRLHHRQTRYAQVTFARRSLSITAISILASIEHCSDTTLKH
jgi:hypothetical protein